MQNQQQAESQKQTTSAQYQNLKHQYLSTGISYKSNEIIRKICNLKGYPYLLVLEIVKRFHMNQFEILFICHILNEEENTYQVDPGMFETSMSVPEVATLFAKMTRNSKESTIRVWKVEKKNKDQLDEEDEQEEQAKNQEQDEQLNQSISNEERNSHGDIAVYWSIKDIKRLYVYMLVIGYSVKYYLNESTKAYEDYLKQKYTEFFPTIFVVWVDKYSSKVLRTNPRKINEFYMQLFQSEENTAVQASEIDCQYRNYNEIVQELIKATSDGDDNNNAGHIEDVEYDG